MSLSTRRPIGIPGSVRPPRSASTTRGREHTVRSQDDLTSPSIDNRYRTTPHSQRSRSVPRQESDNPYRPQRMETAPPMPSHSPRHSTQSSVSSTSTGSSAVSAASTAPSSLWDYVGWKGSAASPAVESEGRVSSPEPLEPSTQPDTLNTSTLWSRVTAVAGGLSVNVSKAWETKDDLPEPDTPPGHDSRVTAALKKHYIKQVSDPRQLPAWLFSDIERQVVRSYSQQEPSSSDGRDVVRNSPLTHEHPVPVRSRTRRDDAYTSPQATIRRERMEAATYNDEAPGPTRAATRLRAMRDARRGSPVEREAYAPAPTPVLEPEPRPVVVVAPPRPRAGLPARPRALRRE
ncbi:sly1 protein [Rhizoctonia solani AG-3 Rhs1AP]|uniref:Sly1 protein n=1 Tax=Rhizoctonia solani AG-3 Rhs1AP TaxID=1086054 RepID=X8JTI6_9AGAM|nr:sly1 protein [Rhizoctonia solani AG-3 Rhs1AP]